MSNNDKVTSTDIKKALAEYYSKDYFITEWLVNTTPPFSPAHGSSNNSQIKSSMFIVPLLLYAIFAFP